MKKNKAFRGADKVPVIEDLGTGSFYFNFNIIENKLIDDETKKESIQHEYNQVRCEYPTERTKEAIIKVVEEQLKENDFEITKDLKKFINENI